MRTALVTGATGGVGQAIAESLVADGVSSIWLLGRRRPALRDGGSGVEGSTKIHAETGDLTSEAFRGRLASTISASIDALDIVVHAAGVYSTAQLASLSREEYDRVFELNVFARCDLTRRLLPLLQQGQGLVVFINSTVATRTVAGAGLYATSMHASRAAADGLRQEVNRSGVRVLNVFLGRTATPMQQEIHKSEGVEYEPHRLIQPETVANAIVVVSRLPRDAEVTDITIRPLLPPRP